MPILQPNLLLSFPGPAAMGLGMAAHMLKCNFLLLMVFMMKVLTFVGTTMKESIPA